MAVSVQKSAIMQGGTSNELIVDVVADRPIPPDLDQIALSIGASEAAPVRIGAAGTAQLSVSANATVALVPVYGDNVTDAKKKTLADNGLDDVFANGQNAGELLMLLDVGANADASAKLPVKYQALSGDVTLSAGVDANYVYARTFRHDLPAADVVVDFFRDFTLPNLLDRPLREDEHLIFDFGGSAKFGASVSAGWQLAGSQALNIGKLKAAEKYAFSVIGKVGVHANVAGRFRIDVRPAPRANWARVTVSKNDQRELGIAADIKAGADFTSAGFPSSPGEFLEAAIGTRAKSWLAYFDAAQEWTDPATVKQKLDTLAQSFIEQWTGRAVEELNAAGLGEVFAEMQKAIDSYNSLGDRAVALFDRYYDPVAQNIEKRIADALEQVTHLDDWTAVKQRVLDNDLFEVLDTLSGGQIAAILNQGEAAAAARLNEIKERAKAILDAVQGNAHKELLKVVNTAKSAFGLDKLVAKLDGVNLTTIKQQTDKRLIGFVERLIDQSIAEVKDSELGKLANDVHEFLGKVESFATTWYAKFIDALSQSFALDVHAGYNRSANRAAMLVFDADLSQADGQTVVRQAAIGDFSGVFSAAPAVVEVQQGTFSRKLASQRVVSINVVGWNKRPWKFDSVRDLVVESTQNLSQTAAGLVATTDTSLSATTTRSRQNEKLMSKFMLSFAGQTQANGDRFDGREFYIDALRSAGARYTLAITDGETTTEELAGYLGLASSLGFNVPDPAGAIARMLPSKNGDYGQVQIDYDVRFSPDGITAALKAKPTERQIRYIARLLVLTNYLANHRMDQDLAWAYWDQGVYAYVKEQNDMSWINLAPRTHPLSTPSPIASKPRPDSIVLNPARRTYLNRLYTAESRMIAAIEELQSIAPPISQEDLAARLNDIGNKLKTFDDVDASDNTYFAIFDHLIAMSGAEGARNATLSVTATLNNKTVKTGLIA